MPLHPPLLRKDGDKELPDPSQTRDTYEESLKPDLDRIHKDLLKESKVNFDNTGTLFKAIGQLEQIVIKELDQIADVTEKTQPQGRSPIDNDTVLQNMQQERSQLTMKATRNSKLWKKIREFTTKHH